MKQRSKVIATSIATIAMCASLAVGGTFALFTSEHEVNIAVTSGTVDVKASVNEESLKTYSMGAIQEKGKFQNGGTAGFNAESKLELSLMTPGDKAEFTVDIANNSNVAIQYKVTFGVSGGLAGVLDCDATNAEDTWIFAEAGKAIDSVAVSVELPESVGNEYQNVTDTTISVKVEAVQGNANVGGATIEDSDKDVALENVLSEDLLKKEDIVVKLGEANLTWETGGGHGSTPFGNENTKTLTIIGESPDVSKLTATGAGVGPIRVDNGTLTIQNVEIVDETVSYAESSWEFTYLELGDGNADTLVFENCVFNKGIQLSGNATFKNCKFNSNEDNEYAVWVDNGSASFEDCYFAGPRGLKMHEDYGSEIVSVTVENCTFESITKKPGIAMGTLNAETTVTIKNSQFIDCQAGDQGLYMYETDTDVNTFTFVNENNVVAKKGSTVTEITEVLANGGSVVFGNDIVTEATTTAPYGNKVALIQNGGVIDGNGKILSVDCYGDDYGIMTSGGTIKNLTINAGCRAIVIMSPTEDIILDNVYVCGDEILYPINTAEHATVEGVDLIVKNSTFGGWSSFAGIDSASFTNCKFIYGGYYNSWPYDSLVKPYVNTTFTDCDFAENYYLDLSALGADCAVVLDNCTVNGTIVTAENCIELFGEVELPTGRTLADCVIFK